MVNDLYLNFKETERIGYREAQNKRTEEKVKEDKLYNTPD